MLRRQLRSPTITVWRSTNSAPSTLMATRTASHAGSWYSVSSSKLETELSAWIEKAHKVGDEGSVQVPIVGCKAIIAPHAGYSYSGPAAAWAYKTIDITKFTRVFILGPSHHVFLDGCALSKCQTYETPIGSLELDVETVKELKETGHFQDMTLQTDEDEHSIEMHLPYIRHIFKDQDIKIVPVLVGAISTSRERFFGNVLAPYLADEKTCFIVSSDFCHWGTRFSYTYYRDPATTTKSTTSLSKTSTTLTIPIHQSIESLDRRGMSSISFPTVLNPDGLAQSAFDQFTAYLLETKNTICGRHPISVLLATIASLQEKEWKEKEVQVVFVKYEQSSQCMTIKDSSVSYASAFVKIDM